ncbi:hypothetical protein RDV78_08385 [Bacillota bacterium LX-D]|nr:hypothetical protein [Bacillota bacterium LX-D]
MDAAKQNPIIEAYIGEYASGKSENAVNRAVELVHKKRQVTLVDLDLVEPFYTLRPIKKQLEELGITVIAWDTKETLGLGEAGSVIKPEMIWVLKRSGDIVLDLGYGVDGARVLNLLVGFKQNPFLKIIAVLNTTRPMTETVDDIIQFVKGLEPVDGLINNTHLGDETTVQLIQEGAKKVNAAAKKLNLPVIATSADERLREQLGAYDQMGNPVRYLKRYMAQTFW